jgi:hypothetical protein
MKKLFKKLFGITKLEEERAVAEAAVLASNKAAEEAKAAEELAKLGPKERATAKGEAWVSVLDTKVNKDNPRNGFFELDWNELFIVELKKNGYGFDGDPDEEIVDRWFRDIVKNMLGEEGLDTTRSAGFINVSRISETKSEAS